jgi:hypothetical protein
MTLQLVNPKDPILGMICRPDFMIAINTWSSL